MVSARALHLIDWWDRRRSAQRTSLGRALYRYSRLRFRLWWRLRNKSRRPARSLESRVGDELTRDEPLLRERTRIVFGT